RPFASPGGGTSRELRRRIAAFSAPRTLSAGIEQSLVWLDVLIVGLIAGPAAAGVYGVVSRLVQSGTIPSTSMRIVVAPLFSKMLHQDRREELDELYTRTAQWIVLFSTPIYVVLAILGEPILRIFGDGFATGALALAVMCIGAVVSACTGNVQALLLMSGRSGWAAINKVVVLAVIVGLLLLLVPPYGILGAAIASTVAVSLDAILASIQIRIGVGLRSNLAAVLLAVLVAGAAAAVPAFAA
ncbi:lipopolysaccharide biosynthesis protein, partial [Leucobacter soli]